MKIVLDFIGEVWDNHTVVGVLTTVFEFWRIYHEKEQSRLEQSLKESG